MKCKLFIYCKLVTVHCTVYSPCDAGPCAHYSCTCSQLEILGESLAKYCNKKDVLRKVSKLCDPPLLKNKKVMMLFTIKIQFKKTLFFPTSLASNLSPKWPFFMITSLLKDAVANITTTELYKYKLCA